MDAPLLNLLPDERLTGQAVEAVRTLDSGGWQQLADRHRGTSIGRLLDRQATRRRQVEALEQQMSADKR